MRNISHLILEAKQHKHKPHQFLAQPTNKKMNKILNNHFHNKKQTQGHVM